MKKTREARCTKFFFFITNLKRLDLFLGILLLSSSLGIKASICSNGYIDYDCDNEMISQNSLPFLGTPPEIFATLTLINDDGSKFPLLDGYKLPSDIELKIGMRIKVDFQLQNGLTEIFLSDGSLRLLPLGKFDADGDPIDNQKTYESIEWYLLNTESSMLSSSRISTNNPLNELTITEDICTKGHAIQVNITPFTYTGDPNQGAPYSLIISNTNGTPYVFKNCGDDYIHKLAIQVKDQYGDYYIDETQTNPITKKETFPGDELSLFLMFKDGQNYIDVTDHYLSQIVWGYKIDTKSTTKQKNIIQDTDLDVIWMDGKQNFGALAKLETINTTGMRTFKIQDNNLDARAIHPYHKSEQSMRLVLKIIDK